MPVRRVFLLFWLSLWLAGCAAPTATPEQITLTVAYPAVVRAGEVGEITLTLEAQNEALDQVFETYNVLAEARLDLPGVQIQPIDLVSETLRPGQQAVFFWSIRPETAGTFEGQVWFYLRFIPKNGGAEIRQALSAQKVRLEVESFFGLNVSAVGWLGAFGLVLSAGLGAPLVIGGLKRLAVRLGKRP